MYVSPPSLQFGRLFIDPQAAVVKDHPYPRLQAADLAGRHLGSLCLLDGLEVDIQIKPAKNPNGDSFVLTHRNRPVVDLRDEIMYLPHHATQLVQTAIDQAIGYVSQNASSSHMGFAGPLKTNDQDLVVLA